ncbi:MAG: serine/threonine protein kinase [Myxococcaceae bacterium]|nr:serine/threonine protein kinase [Myxococcaceae bacterium]
MESHEVHPSCLVSGEWVGAWRILKRLGAGAFGAVYLVECEGEVLALKFSLRQVESGDLNQTGARLQKELACLLQIQHPNVVRIHAFGRWPHPMQGYPYLLMDYVEGPTLHEWRRRERPTFREVIVLFGKLALTLDALDHEQIRHRDMKGSNILVRARDGEPILVDFGAADYAQAARLTEGPLPPGTPHYRSPEAIRFQRQHFKDRAARYTFRVTDDLYGLGVALYEVLAGRLPFSPDLPWEVLNAEIELKVPLPPAHFDERIPPAVSRLVMRLIAKHPKDRPQTGRALYEELQALLCDGGPALDERTFAQSVDLVTTEPD